MSVMCSLITDRVSFMTGESSALIKLYVRELFGEVSEVLKAACAKGDAWL